MAGSNGDSKAKAKAEEIQARKGILGSRRLSKAETKTKGGDDPKSKGGGK